MFPPLNLPSYEHRISSEEGTLYIFDPIRKKKVILTPEEWVRQNFVRYLSDEKKYPVSRIAVEMSLTVNGMTRRCDLVYFSKSGIPEMIVECKASSVKVTQAAFDQAARYNLTLKVPLLVITNGLDHYCCRINHEQSGYEFLREVPEYLEL